MIYLFMTLWNRCVIIIFQNTVDVSQVVRTCHFSSTLSGLAITYCRLWCFWMNTLFSQPIHHTAGNIVLQHLVFRLFLCSKHCWYKPFVLHPTMLAKPHYCSIMGRGFWTNLNKYCYRTNYYFFVCILFGGLKRIILFQHYLTLFLSGFWMKNNNPWTKS